MDRILRGSQRGGAAALALRDGVVLLPGNTAGVRLAARLLRAAVAVALFLTIALAGPMEAFAAAGPSITSVTPNTGPVNGGTVVTINGSGFTGVFMVYFGTSEALSFSSTSDTSISATVPPGSAGATSVSVTTPSGSNTGGSFTYLETLTDEGSVTTGLVDAFFNAQADLTLANLPDGQRRIDRLRGVVALPTDPGSAVMDYVPQAGSGNVQAPVLSAGLAEINTIAGKSQSPFDAWFQGTLGTFNGNDLSGNFGIVSLGADYVLDKDLLVGGFVQVDAEPNATSQDGDGSISGDGWIAGPYATLRLNDGLYLDVLAAGGTSHNTLSPGGTYTASFEATRWLASAALTGQWQMGNWTFAPTARLSYFRSTSEAYVDNLGIDIPAASAGVGQLAAGPHLSYRFDLGDGIEAQTSLGLDGVLSVTTDDTLGSVTDLHGRVQVGINFATPGGASFGLSGNYEGLGAAATSSTAGSTTLSVPIN